jgi:arylsulfatase A-like enzyme
MPRQSTLSRREFMRAAAASVAASSVAGLFARTPILRIASADANPKNRPNILFLLMDDMGWMDTSVYGSRYYETPHIDRLAEKGVRFTDAHAANPLCSPTRASIMTGKYPGRLKLTAPTGHLPTDPTEPTVPEKGRPNQRFLLPGSRTQLPLEEYTLAEALKDAGYHTGFIGKWHLGQEPFWPDKQGFDVTIAGAHNPGPGNYFSPYHLENLKDGPPGEYITDRLTDEAIHYIEDHRDEPFFLCLWHFAVHSPWNAPLEDMEPFLGKVDPRGEQHNPVIAGIHYNVDRNLGRLFAAIEELGIADDTLIIFTSDNGQLLQVPGSKGAPRRNTPLRGGDHVSSNAPLRGGKGQIWEGGTRVPLIVMWPGRIPPGSVCDTPVSSVDFYPTLLEAAGAAPRPGQVIDGESLLPLLTGTGELKREAIFCHFPHTPVQAKGPSAYVRKGDWKMIRYFELGDELYNLREDIGETTDLSSQRPDILAEMQQLMDRFLRDTGSLIPALNPNYAANR